MSDEFGNVTGPDLAGLDIVRATGRTLAKAMSGPAGQAAPFPGGGGAPIPGGGQTSAFGAAAAKYGISGGAGAAGELDNMLVFLGWNRTRETVQNSKLLGDSYGKSTPTNYRKHANTASYRELVRQFEALSNTEKQEWAKRLLMAGYLEKPRTVSYQELLQAYNSNDIAVAYELLLADAAGRYAKGVKVTPDQLLAQRTQYVLHNLKLDESAPASSWWKMLTRYENKNGPAGTGGTGGEVDPFTGTKVQVDVSRDIFSVSDARALARATLVNALGREPSKEEYEDFVAALQTEQRQNPTRTKTKYTYDEGELTKTNTTSRGGLNEEQWAYEYAKDQPGYAEWQAVGTYLPVALNALGAGVPGA